MKETERVFPSVPLPKQRVFTVTVENVTAEFLVEKQNETEKQKTKNDPITSVTKHDHAYIELFACTSGSVRIDTEQGELVLFAGDVAVIPARLKHILETGEDIGMCDVAGFTFARRHMTSGSDLFSLLNGLFGRNKTTCIKNCPDLCGAVAGLARAPAKSETCLPALRLTLLLAEAAERLSLLKNQGTGAVLIGGDMDRASRLDYLINSCFTCDLSAKYAAESLYISERQLMRITKKRYGTTFRQALQDKRLEVAAKLLSETDDSVAAICRKVGFRSASHFYRSFGDRFGLTPSEYRSRRSGKNET